MQFNILLYIKISSQLYDSRITVNNGSENQCNMELAFSEGELLDGSRASTALNCVDTLDGLRDEVGKEVVSIKDQGLEHLSCWDGASELISKSESSHDRSSEFRDD